MANSSDNSRPLSPHLQIYRPQITSVLSILHRITGVAMIASLKLVIFWFIAVAFDLECLKLINSFVHSWFGTAFLIASLWAFFYHMCNGIRHLFWDAGYGFELSTMAKSGYAVVIVSAILTVVIIYVAMGGPAR